MSRYSCLAFVFITLVAATASHAAEAPGPGAVKVFILAGQSNMEGKAKVSLLEYQVKQPATRPLFEHLQKDGQWIEREDVFIKFFDRKGKLTVGYGSPKCIGPELEFGNVVGNHYKESVLLIKTAWGGRSLQRDFRSPSAGFPSDESMAKMLEQMQKQRTEQNKKLPADQQKPAATMEDVKAPFGASYRAMLEEVRTTLADLGKHFPQLQGRETELAGLVWFQGWNDMINAEATAEYASNMSHFIRDVRKDLKAPNLPVVIGQMGVDGKGATGNVVKFKDAQAATLKDESFKGNVALVKTDEYWDLEAEKVFKKDWRKHLEEWNTVGSDWPFHYLGSAKTMLGIGKGFGEAMLKLREGAD